MSKPSTKSAVVLRKSLELVTSKIRIRPPTSGNPAKMSSTTVSAADSSQPIPSQQPMLASQRAKLQQDMSEESKTRRTGGFGAYFPLGYKEAVHQWVRRSPFPRCPVLDVSRLSTTVSVPPCTSPSPLSSPAFFAARSLCCTSRVSCLEKPLSCNATLRSLYRQSSSSCLGDTLWWAMTANSESPVDDRLLPRRRTECHLLHSSPPGSRRRRHTGFQQA